MKNSIEIQKTNVWNSVNNWTVFIFQIGDLTFVASEFKSPFLQWSLEASTRNIVAKKLPSTWTKLHLFFLALLRFWQAHCRLSAAAAASVKL